MNALVGNFNFSTQKPQLKFRLMAIVVFFAYSGWTLAANPSSQEEALKCMVFVQAYDANGEMSKRGSGFVANDSGAQWIFTNAHVIEGAARIEFIDHAGAKLADFGRFQCFSEESGSGDHGNDRFGGDGVRIELKKPMKMAFTIAKNTDQFTNSAKVVTLGDNDGNRRFDVLEGSVSAVSNFIIQSTCQARPGSSGGALIDPESFEVIGLNTFGISGSVKLADAIWQKGIDENVAGASILNRVKWMDMKASDFLKGSDVAMRFRDTVRMLAFIHSLVPQEGGFKIDLDNEFAMNITFEQAFDKFSRDLILRPVINLNRQLAGRDGNIGINKMSLVKIYANAILKIRESYDLQRRELITSLAPYYRIEFKNSGFYEVGDWCYKSLEDAQLWFHEKSRLGGTLPVGRWYNLRPLSELGK